MSTTNNRAIAHHELHGLLHATSVPDTADILRGTRHAKQERPTRRERRRQIWLHRLDPGAGRRGNRCAAPAGHQATGHAADAGAGLAGDQGGWGIVDGTVNTKGAIGGRWEGSSRTVSESGKARRAQAPRVATIALYTECRVLSGFIRRNFKRLANSRFRLETTPLEVFRAGAPSAR